MAFEQASDFAGAKVANLLDKDYQTINTYNSYDRNFFVSFHYRSR